MIRKYIVMVGLACWLFFLPVPTSSSANEQIINPSPSSTPSTLPLSLSDEPPTTRLLFAGQIVPGRCVQAGVERRGNADYIYANVRDIIQSADLAIATLNGSITDISPSVGCVVNTLVLSGTPVQTFAIANAGFDVVSVSTNHINNCSLNNCGYRPFLDTLTSLKRAGIVAIGGGNNLTEALIPRFYTINGVRFAFISLGEIEPGVFATYDHPGIAALNEANLFKILQMARKYADVVIFLPHWGPEYNPLPNPSQMKYARLAVAEGADLIIGNHTHVIQGQQIIDGVQVFYGLGNFVFDQSWDLSLRSSLLVEVTYVGKEYRGYRIIPVVAAKDGLLSFPPEEDRLQILTDFENASKKIKP